jgi:hypothetical protein
MLNHKDENPTTLNIILATIITCQKAEKRHIPNDFKHKNTTYSVLDFAGENMVNTEGLRNL